jgi:hypothetical protein
MHFLVKIIMTVLVLGSMTLAGTCFAFFPQPGEVAERVRKEMKPLSSFQAILSFPDYPEITCNLWVQGETWRQEFVDASGESPRLARVALGTHTSLVRAFPDQGRAALPWLVIWQFPVSTWTDKGMDPAVMSYQFLLDRPSLVMGAKDGELQATQLWIDNERHVPLRAMWQKGYGGCDLIWDEWARIGNFWLPHRIWYAADGQHPLEIRVRWNGVNVPLNKDLFSPRIMDQQFQGKAMYSSSSLLFTFLDACSFFVQTAH